MVETRLWSIRGRKLRLIRYDTVDSTQRVARELPVGTIIIAHAQTAGYGRYGREWISPPGGLYASIIVAPDPLLPLRAGVAVAEALSAYGIDARLKWPNDVTVRGKKIAGILIENGPEKMILGIGVNLDKIPYPNATSVRAAGVAVPQPEELLSIISDKLVALVADDAIAARYRDLCVTIGKQVIISVGPKEIRGRALGIDQRGRLLVQTRTGVHRIHSGDCHHVQEDAFDVEARPR